MKKATRTIAAVAMCAFLGFSEPIHAQNENPATTTQRANDVDDDDDDDTGKWGLAGLLGLLGLIGLRKRDDHRDIKVTPRV